MHAGRGMGEAGEVQQIRIDREGSVEKGRVMQGQRKITNYKEGWCVCVCVCVWREGETEREE